ncbi:hypothetical protein THRCLA_03541 [Thraustotheca clavata]|uniref:Uncharacterized protein n=1 Tax=Thraustotheca clavata TaxID=74557 RepID=A0A1W0A202_9STRA|nr:hypothetical protein THRCLA_03541 [Thraustotheca clavata]
MSPTDLPGINPAYPRLLMYQELTSLESAVHGLHTLEASKVNSMITQYCWADFNHKRSIAHALLRQIRCENYKTNAAILHLVSLIAFIGDPIAQTPGGEAWDQVALWKNLSLVYFQLAYTNHYQIGIEEKISIENALGQLSIVTIKSLPSTRRGSLWTSSYLYLGFHYDFVAVAFSQSLARNTHNFFGDIDETQIEVYDAGYPLPEFYQAVHDQVGPLGTIDLIYISPPNDLVVIVENFRSLVFAALGENPSIQTDVKTFGTFELFPTPKKWQSPTYTFFGGNMMCEYPTETNFIQNSFGFDDTCSGTSVLEVNMNMLNG